jgi:hypothetical protein
LLLLSYYRHTCTAAELGWVAVVFDFLPVAAVEAVGTVEDTAAGGAAVAFFFFFLPDFDADLEDDSVTSTKKRISK